MFTNTLYLLFFSYCFYGFAVDYKGPLGLRLGCNGFLRLHLSYNRLLGFNLGCDGFWNCIWSTIEYWGLYSNYNWLLGLIHQEKYCQVLVARAPFVVVLTLQCHLQLLSQTSNTYVILSKEFRDSSVYLTLIRMSSREVFTLQNTICLLSVSHESLFVTMPNIMN